MTVSSTINREQYATNGSTAAFAIHFPFFNDTDVNAIFVSSGGVSTVLALNTDFTVAGGILTTAVPPANGGTLTIYREIPYTQEDDYVEDDPLPADTLEGGFDRAAMRDQQLKDAIDRALVAPVTVPPNFTGALPTPVADLLIGWNSDGTAMENKNPVALDLAVRSTEDTAMAAESALEVTTPLSLARAIRMAKLSGFTLCR